MSPALQELAHTAKTVATLVVASSAIFGVVFGLGAWMIGLQTKEAAKSEHIKIETKILEGDTAVETKSLAMEERIIDAIKTNRSEQVDAISAMRKRVDLIYIQVREP